MINPPTLPQLLKLFQIIYSSFFFPVLMAHTSLAPFFHHKKIFHIIEIHNHCESSYEYRKMFWRRFCQCFMIIKMVHPQSFSRHIASTRHSQDVIRNFIQNRRRFFLILQDQEMWKYERGSVNKMELFMKKSIVCMLILRSLNKIFKQSCWGFFL